MPGRIRLLYLINSFVMGGAEKAMVRIISGLNKDKYDITAVSLQERTEQILPELEKINVRIVKLSATGKHDLRIVYRLYNLIKYLKPDVLICSLFHSTILGRITGSITKTPVIINWEHNENFGSRWRKLLNKSTVKLSDRIFCDSEKVKSEAIKQLSANINLVTTIPIGGVDLTKFKINPNKNSRFIEVGTVGMMSKQKGFVHFIEAAKLVLEKNNNVRISIAGDGPELENLQNLIEKLKLNDKIKLLGFRCDIAALLGQWDIYVQPSLWEGLCMTVVEAMACGLPVIASNVGGIPESVFEGRNGFLIQPKDKLSLADKIVQLAENPNLRIEMGRQGRIIAEERYCLTTMCEIIENSIDELIKIKLKAAWNKENNIWQPCLANMDSSEDENCIAPRNRLAQKIYNYAESVPVSSGKKELTER